MSIDSAVLHPLFTLFTQLHAHAEALPAPIKSSLTELTAEAKQTGLDLFNLRRDQQARFFLTIAGAAGDAEAQYTMATCVSYLQGGVRLYSSETKKWLLLAAAQNHIPALMRLGDAESLAKAKALATTAPFAETPRAMVYLYVMTKDIEWLRKAAAAGDPEALYRLAGAYEENPELLPDAQEREVKVALLTQQAADAGYAEAVSSLAFSRDKAVSVAEKQKRIIQLALMGNQEALLVYGYALAGLSQDKTRAPHTYGLEKNLPKACAVLEFLLITESGSLVRQPIEEDLWALKHQMLDTRQSEVYLRELQVQIPRVFSRMGPLLILGSPL
ncbi:hypothetical protein C4J98_2234 [Pseudomonas orientalis]|uniref:tetratricopeptide repeat protein n=1 Tax=Pseudomonas orientalis TaxID=76758 RepID=UPI000F565B8E|nr:sel1 repeat family protein [Pseudomonas orientalis]AZE83647.1 hypothetical protein C4J98_2234 [Pseudomonas orientalis]